MLTIFAFLAQVVLTLRSAFFASDGLVLTRAELNRIYAITSKNRIIASCFGVITISQFGLGLYVTSDTAERGCKSVTKLLQVSCLPQFLSVTDPNDPTSDLYGVQLHGTVFCGNRICCNFSSIWYGTSLTLHRSSRRLPSGLFRRLSSLLGHRLSRGTVQRNEDTNTQSVEDYSARCDVLFPGHIHFTFRSEVGSLGSVTLEK